MLKEEGVDPLATAPAAVANQLINTRLRAIELKRKVREQDDVLERIAALEDQDRERRGYGTWAR